MLIDTALEAGAEVTTTDAKAAEDACYDGVWIGESKFDPFLRCLLAAQATEHVTVGTSVAIAFGRTPLTLAHLGYDLARYSQGRFVMGLGSQVKPHIERRFSMPWSKPAARMRELVLATKAIWACWQDGTKLDFAGEFYTHTLMTPFFSPPRHDFGAPPIWLAGLGELMTQVAGEVCDGFIVHPFTTPKFFADVTKPALERGRAAGGHVGLDGFPICSRAFVAIGRNDEELAAAIRGTKDQIAFYASTPAYRPVLEAHGYGDLQPELTAMTKQGRWKELADAIDDTLFDIMTVTGDPQTVGRGVAERWGGLFDRVALYVNYPIAPEVLVEAADAVRRA